MVCTCLRSCIIVDGIWPTLVLWRYKVVGFFDGEIELGKAPRLLSGTEILNKLCDVNVTFGKPLPRTASSKRKRRNTTVLGWKKESIFFVLPYLEHLLLRHNLDVMHIEKNISDSLVGTLLNIEGKTKDSLDARLDLQQMGIQHKLYPIIVANKIHLPPPCFTMTTDEKKIFCSVLSKVRVSNGYAVNLSRCVNVKEHKLTGMKGHDYHILMQQLLPLAIRRCPFSSVSGVIIELCNYFRGVCSKVGTTHEFRKMESEIPIILCQLERTFPPAFFDIMLHLAVHLATEARIAGPVHYRWMYLIER